jgi:hypothetical protein
VALASPFALALALEVTPKLQLPELPAAHASPLLAVIVALLVWLVVEVFVAGASASCEPEVWVGVAPPSE